MTVLRDMSKEVDPEGFWQVVGAGPFKVEV